MESHRRRRPLIARGGRWQDLYPHAPGRPRSAHRPAPGKRANDLAGRLRRALQNEPRRHQSRQRCEVDAGGRRRPHLHLRHRRHTLLLRCQDRQAAMAQGIRLARFRRGHLAGGRPRRGDRARERRRTGLRIAHRRGNCQHPPGGDAKPQPHRQRIRRHRRPALADSV